MKKIVEVR